MTSSTQLMIGVPPFGTKSLFSRGLRPLIKLLVQVLQLLIASQIVSVPGWLAELLDVIVDLWTQIKASPNLQIDNSGQGYKRIYRFLKTMGQ